MLMIQSVKRALILLEFIAAAGTSGISLTSLSASAGLKAPTCRNILGTLVLLGYVRQLPGSRLYVSSWKAVFGRQQALEHALSQYALPILQQLSQQICETIILCSYSNGRRKTLLALESRQALRVTVQEGEDENFFGTATGRLLLSMLSSQELSLLLKNQKKQLQQWPEISSPTVLSSKLAEIRKIGRVAFNKEDIVQALAVPIVLSQNRLLLALGLYYPSARHPEAEQPALLEQLQVAAHKIADFTFS